MKVWLWKISSCHPLRTLLSRGSDCFWSFFNCFHSLFLQFNIFRKLCQGLSPPCLFLFLPLVNTAAPQKLIFLNSENARWNFYKILCHQRTPALSDHLPRSHSGGNPFPPTPTHWTLIRMMYVQVWSPFLLPPVYCFRAWLCKPSTTAMMTLFRALQDLSSGGMLQIELTSRG